MIARIRLDEIATTHTRFPLRVVIPSHAVEALRLSIRQHGLRRPPLVLPKDSTGMFPLIAGLLRVEACKREGHEWIDVKILDVTDDEAALIAAEDGRESGNPRECLESAWQVTAALWTPDGRERSNRELQRHFGYSAGKVSYLKRIGTAFPRQLVAEIAGELGEPLNRLLLLQHKQLIGAAESFHSGEHPTLPDARVLFRDVAATAFGGEVVEAPAFGAEHQRGGSSALQRFVGTLQRIQSVHLLNGIRRVQRLIERFGRVLRRWLRRFS